MANDSKNFHAVNLFLIKIYLLRLKFLLNYSMSFITLLCFISTNFCYTPISVTNLNFELLSQTSDTQRLLIQQPTSILPETIKPLPDKWFALDKFYHLAVSFSLVGSNYHLFANRLNIKEPAAICSALGGTFVLGIAKEVFDALRPDDRFSYRDLITNLIGIGLGYLVFIH